MKKEFTVVNVMESNSVVVVSTKGTRIKLGTLCRLYSKSDELFDPDTGESLGYAELFKGSGVVVQCNRNLAYIHCIKMKKVSPLYKTAINVSAFGINHTLTEIPWEDRYVIDEEKYAKSTFLSPQNGDIVSID